MERADDKKIARLQSLSWRRRGAKEQPIICARDVSVAAIEGEKSMSAGRERHTR
jgi:hypothetical protein